MNDIDQNTAHSERNAMRPTLYNGLLILLFLSVYAVSLRALPRYALMTGTKCASCHMNPTGGQMRNDYGISFSMDKLPLEALRDSDFSFNGKLSDNISIGGDYRSQFLYDQFSKTTAFQSMTTSLYGSVRLSKKISFQFKQDLVNGTYNGPNGGIYNGTEVFGVARILPNGGYIKGGSFLPDYGWRLDDHTVYTRGGDLGFTGAGYHQSLIFVPNYHDIGAEVGMYVDNFFLTAGLFNGTGQLQPIDFSKDKAYVAKLEYMGSLGDSHFRIVASGYGFRQFKMGGFTAGLSTADNNLVLLGEADWTQHDLYYNYIPATSSFSMEIADGANTMAAMAEIDYRVVQGLWLTGRYDLYDPLEGVGEDDNSASTNSVKHITLGMEFFPYSFVEIRPQYRLIIERPSIDNDVALVQMHFWF